MPDSRGRLLAGVGLAALVGAGGCQSAPPAPTTGVTITTPVSNVTVVEGQAAVFRVTVEAALPFVVEWRRDGTVVERGGTTFTIAAATLADDLTVISARVVAGTFSTTAVDGGSGRLTVRLAPPAAPTGFVAPINAAGFVAELAWIDNSSNESGFELLHDGPRGPVVFDTWPANSSAGFAYSYTQGTVETIYVRAVREEGGRRAESSVAAVTVSWPVVGAPPAAPTNLVIAPVPNVAGQVDATWTDATDEDGYAITVHNNGREWPAAAVGRNATTIRLGGLTPGSTYTYSVRSFREIGGAFAMSAPATRTFTVPF
jgi:hypothetical protein